MLKDKSKSGYDDSSVGYSATETGVTRDESTFGTSYDGSTGGGSTTYTSEYEKIEILDESSEALDPVPEDQEVSEDDSEESSQSVSESYYTGIEDEESSIKEKGSRCPKRYPLWLCPPFWFMHPKKAWRNRTACLANVIFLGCSVYYFILVNVGVDNATVSQYLWIAPTMVILYTANLIKKNLKLTKVVVSLAARVQYQIDIQNEMAEDINQLGEKGKAYRQEVVNLRDVITETKAAGKRLAWRNKQSIKEVDHVEKFISKYKPPKTVEPSENEEENAETAGKSKDTPETEKAKEEEDEVKEEPVVKLKSVEEDETFGEMKTQGKLVDSRLLITSKREHLAESIEEQNNVLNEVKQGIGELKDYHDEFTNDAEDFKKTLEEFKETVNDVDTQIDNLEDLKEYSKTPMDASNADLREYLTEIINKRSNLRALTLAMEVSLLRDLFLSKQFKSGESGMDRETFEQIKKEIPAAAQRAIMKMENRGTFDEIRVQSKAKIMDNKLGRKKRPGINMDGMRAFLDAVEVQMKIDIGAPLKSLLKPGIVIGR